MSKKTIVLRLNEEQADLLLTICGVGMALQTAILEQNVQAQRTLGARRLTPAQVFRTSNLNEDYAGIAQLIRKQGVGN